MDLTSDNLLEYMNRGADFSGKERSYSPMASNIGLNAASGALYTHYNRQTTAVYAPLFALPGAVLSREADIDGLRARTEKGTAEFAFYQTDALLMRWTGEGEIALAAPGDGKATDVWMETRKGGIVLRGYFPVSDARDPDGACPFALGARVIKGASAPLANGGFRLTGNEILVAVSFACLTRPAERALEALVNAPEDFSRAARATRNWFCECTRDFSVPVRTHDEAAAAGKAVRSLLFNLCQAPGALSGRISAFPNRGKYPTLFLWDSCFQNLAYERFYPRAAADSLLGLAENRRADGKIPQFICSTWVRPHETQPALMGWAARRLTLSPGDEEAMLTAVEQNCHWWLNSRMTRYGLVVTPSGLECGWDDSPRYDQGPILALDMNSYLLDQIEYARDMCEKFGRADDARAWETRRNTLGENMMRVLYDKEKNLFFDALAETGEKLPAVSPAAFLPLWAGAPLPLDRSRDMIERYLLSPAFMNGPIPFPSIAYGDPAYQSDKWWRGPAWPPVAWLMLETLQKYGFRAQAREIRDRFFDMILRDGEMSELFDSQTGKGLGGREQGWTAAIFLRMLFDRAQEEA